jgi:hypothetical protein
VKPLVVFKRILIEIIAMMKCFMLHFVISEYAKPTRRSCIRKFGVDIQRHGFAIYAGLVLRGSFYRQTSIQGRQGGSDTLIRNTNVLSKTSFSQGIGWFQTVRNLPKLARLV